MLANSYPTKNDRLLKQFKDSLCTKDLSEIEMHISNNLQKKTWELAELIIMNLPESDRRDQVLETLLDTCYKSQRLIRIDP